MVKYFVDAWYNVREVVLQSPAHFVVVFTVLKACVLSTEQLFNCFFFSYLHFQEQPLGDWVVRRTYPDSGDISFHIPSSCVLAGGQTLTVSSYCYLCFNYFPQMPQRSDMELSVCVFCVSDLGSRFRGGG